MTYRQRQLENDQMVLIRLLEAFGAEQDRESEDLPLGVETAWILKTIRQRLHLQLNAVKHEFRQTMEDL
jgi:hypothetical protein